MHEAPGAFDIVGDADRPHRRRLQVRRGGLPGRAGDHRRGRRPGRGPYPKGDDGAKALLQALPKDPALVQKLQPTTEDYKALFVGAAAAKAEQFYKTNVWTGQKVEVAGSAGQTELKLAKASSDDLKAWTSAAEAEFPGGYKDVGPHLQPGVTWYRWKYTEPGKDSGMAFDGLAHVNGHWVWTPKPWKALEG